MFDLNQDGVIDNKDHRIWVHEIKITWYGDANLDGDFGEGDIVLMFQAGKFETGLSATWQQGDFNGDGVFGSSDLVTAFIDGGFERGPRNGVVVVPEPELPLLWVLCLDFAASADAHLDAADGYAKACYAINGRFNFRVVAISYDESPIANLQRFSAAQAMAIGTECRCNGDRTAPFPLLAPVQNPIILRNRERLQSIFS